MRIDRCVLFPENGSVAAKIRSLLLALALEASAGETTRFVRFRRRKECYFSTLLLRPEEYRLIGLVLQDEGVELLWQYTGRPRLQPA